VRTSPATTGFFDIPQKYFEIFLPLHCQNRVFHTVSYRGANFIFPRARSPPPFLGTGNQPRPRKGAAIVCMAICPDYGGFVTGEKIFFNFFHKTLPKLRFPYG